MKNKNISMLPCKVQQDIHMKLLDKGYCEDDIKLCMSGRLCDIDDIIDIDNYIDKLTE